MVIKTRHIFFHAEQVKSLMQHLLSANFQNSLSEQSNSFVMSLSGTIGCTWGLNASFTTPPTDELLCLLIIVLICFTVWNVDRIVTIPGKRPKGDNGAYSKVRPFPSVNIYCYSESLFMHEQLQRSGYTFWVTLSIKTTSIVHYERIHSEL